MKVIVGLSGGVDSAVTAHLLLEQGYNVEALFMKNWDEDDGTDFCTAKEDLAQAQAVSDHLGIKLHHANFASEYWDNVFEYFLAEYKACRTPNPDILCNKEIKFKVFASYAHQLGADAIATGHYARILKPDLCPSKSLPLWDKEPPSQLLATGLDPQKDQSYFLHALTTDQLSKSLFPLGEMQKSAVRSLAKQLGLPNHDRKDSTGICFIGERRFKAFLERFFPHNPGPILSLSGEELGVHQGLAYYTIGQRQGLGIGGKKTHGEAPWYVAKKEMATNALIIVQGTDHPALFAQGLKAEQPHWIHPLTALEPGRWVQCQAKIRYRQQAQSCRFRLIDTADGGALEVAFETPQRAVTPGQFIVFYLESFCLGGACITEPLAHLSQITTQQQVSHPC